MDHQSSLESGTMKCTMVFEFHDDCQYTYMWRPNTSEPYGIKKDFKVHRSYRHHDEFLVHWFPILRQFFNEN